MRVKSLTSRYFAEGQCIFFGPRLTLIRGGNGVGKTLVVELLSFLGHLSVMEVADNKFMDEDRFCTINLIKEPQDTKGFSAVMGLIQTRWNSLENNLTDAEYSSVYEWTCKYFGSSANGVSALSSIVSAGTDIEVSLFWSRSVSSRAKQSGSEIKSVLADEAQIASKVVFRARSSGQDVSAALKLWIAWNRPSQVQLSQPEGSGPDGGDQPVKVFLPRTMRHFLDGKDLINFGCVSYINTDMYEFGCGLDIRESPKDLMNRLSEVLIDRLQVTNHIRADLFSAVIPDSPHETVSINSSTMIKPILRTMFGADRQFAALQGQKSAGGADAVSWTVQSGGKFMSSGENQGFFVLNHLFNIHGPCGITIFDEPEIHLSLRSASVLFRELFQRSRTTPGQIIIVTHHPLMYREKIDLLGPKHWYQRGDGRFSDERVDLVFVSMRDHEGCGFDYGETAIKRAASVSHRDAMEMLSGVALWPDSVLSLKACFASLISGIFAALSRPFTEVGK